MPAAVSAALSATLSAARALAAALCAWLALAHPAARAATDATSLRTEALAATCANCHGTQGRAIAQAAVPGLAGLPKGYFVAQMAAFKAGQREATVMHQIAKGFNDAQVELLAAWFAGQPR